MPSGWRWPPHQVGYYARARQTMRCWSKLHHSPPTSVAGGWSPEAAALRLQLKEAAGMRARGAQVDDIHAGWSCLLVTWHGIAAGKLMGQLHDRNCRRPFAPPEAFQADALPADRFQSEIQVRWRHRTSVALGWLRRPGAFRGLHTDCRPSQQQGASSARWAAGEHGACFRLPLF